MAKFEQGNPGRKAGSPNKSTRALKDAILLAAEEVGADGKGKQGLLGYLKLLAVDDSRSYASLLGRVLPLQVQAELEHSGQITVEIVKFADGYGKAAG